jgi:hypothetical protein
MKFTCNGVESIERIGEPDEQGRYMFTVHVAAKEMTDVITAQLYCYGNVIYQQTYTVKEYAKYLIASSTDEKVVGIARALLDYGAAAQKYFIERDGGTVEDAALANGGFSGDWGSDVYASDVRSYMPYVTGTQPTGVQFYGTSLLMESQTTIRHYFIIKNAETLNNITVTVGTTNPQELEPQKGAAHKDGGYFYYVDITGIDAANLYLTFKVTISDGDNSFAVHYSALSHVQQILTHEYDQNEQRLAKALYLYNRSVTEEELPLPGGDNEFEILPF